MESGFGAGLFRFKGEEEVVEEEARLGMVRCVGFLIRYVVFIGRYIVHAH